MSISLFFEISKDGLITKVHNKNMPQDWFEMVDWNAYINKNADVVLYNLDIIEINGKCFFYEIINIDNKNFIFLNQDDYYKLLYRNVLNNISEGIQVFDRNGYLVYANEASQKLENYNFSDYKDKHLLDLYNLSEDFSTALSVLKTEEPVINRCDKFITKDNKELVTINSGYPIKINSQLIGACVFETDLSVLKKFQNKSFDLEHFIRTDSPSVAGIKYSFNDIIHQSESMRQCINYSKKAALSHANILILGETGTGKELVAQSIHNYSSRSLKPFIDVNCGALPSNLVESLFFGTEKGAFTGSLDKRGFFDLANGGTLFLDEINSMDYELQGKLLRAIQEKKISKSWRK